MALSLAAAMLAVLPPRWDAPAECPDASALAQRIEALAGRVPQDGELDARVMIDGPPWRATIELARGDAIERRVVEAEACAGLLDASAVVIAVAMDPVVVARRNEPAFERRDRTEVVPEPRDAPAPFVEPIRDSPAVTRAPSRSAAPRGARRGVGLRVGGGVGVGGWDRAAGGVELALAWSRNALGLELVGRYWIPRRDALADRGAVRIELGTVAAQACWLGGRSRVAFAACGGVEAGAFVVDGVAPPASERVLFPWVAPLVGGRIGFRVRAPLVLFVGLEAAVPLTQAQASLRAAEPIVVYEAGAPAVRGFGGIELRWSLVPRP